MSAAACIFEALFHKLLARCQQRAPGHGFRFKNKLYSLDATTIDLCLSVFSWSHSQQSKGAIKRHVGLDHGGMLPEFVAITALPRRCVISEYGSTAMVYR